VKHFSRVKTNLELIVTDLQLKMNGLIKENKKLRERMEQQYAEIKQFKEEIHNMLTDIKDYKLLKKSIVRMYKKYVNNQEMGRLKTKIVGGDSNLHAKQTKER